jgi:hypothetical protein
MPSIFEENDSRVRVTACFMRLKKPDLGASGSSVFSGSLLLPKRLIMIAWSRLEFKAPAVRQTLAIRSQWLLCFLTLRRKKGARMGRPLLLVG